MDVKIQEALRILGFELSAQEGKIPKMKYVSKKYHKLAMMHHPDRPGGDEKVFKPITEAYRLIGEYLERQKDENVEEAFDFEEEVARNTFKQFQFCNVKENMRSFTIHIENSSSLTWTKVLSKHYGAPKDRKTNGLHWKVASYTDGNHTGNITIGKWHMPKIDNQSNLLVQSTEVGNFLPAHYVDHVLPKLFEEVKANQEGLELQVTSKEGVSGKEVKTSLAGIQCKECEFVGRTINGLTHVRKAHNK